MQIEELTVLIKGFAPYMAFISVMFALLTIYRAKKQSDAWSDHTERLINIQNSLSTQYLGEFPLFCGNIVELISKAKKSIDILCDVPGYGLFSEPVAWVKYRNELQTKIDDPDIRVRIITLDAEARRKLYMDFFPQTIEYWNCKLEEDYNFRKCFENFSYRYLEGKPIREITKAEFLDAHLTAQNICLKYYFGNANKTEVNSLKEIPVYFWVVDETEAIFSFPTLAETGFEHGFRTTDKALIIVFKDLFEHKLTSGVRVICNQTLLL